MLLDNIFLRRDLAPPVSVILLDKLFVLMYVWIDHLQVLQRDQVCSFKVLGSALEVDMLYALTLVVTPSSEPPEVLVEWQTKRSLGL